MRLGRNRGSEVNNAGEGFEDLYSCLRTEMVDIHDLRWQAVFDSFARPKHARPRHLSSSKRHLLCRIVSTFFASLVFERGRDREREFGSAIEEEAFVGRRWARRRGFSATQDLSTHKD